MASRHIHGKFQQGRQGEDRFKLSEKDYPRKGEDPIPGKRENQADARGAPKGLCTWRKSRQKNSAAEIRYPSDDQQSQVAEWEVEFTWNSGGRSSCRTVGPADLFSLTMSRSRVTEPSGQTWEQCAFHNLDHHHCHTGCYFHFCDKGCEGDNNELCM